MEGGSSTGIPIPARGLRVLLVDYDTTSLLHVAAALERNSYKVTSTKLTITALAMLRGNTEQFDVVLADLDMQEMDMFEFIECVQLIKEMPIILMSATEARIIKIREALAKGACFFFTKPVPEKVLNNLWQHVWRKRMSMRTNLQDNNITQSKSNDSPSERTANYGKRRSHATSNTLHAYSTTQWRGVSETRASYVLQKQDQFPFGSSSSVNKQSDESSCDSNSP